jgi:CYTH domain-containing protein
MKRRLDLKEIRKTLKVVTEWSKVGPFLRKSIVKAIEQGPYYNSDSIAKTHVKTLKLLEEVDPISLEEEIDSIITTNHKQGYEIERRWLLSELPKQNLVGAKKIKQAYLQNKLRIRIISSKKAYITKKEGEGLLRCEIECEVPLWIGIDLFNLAVTLPIEKIRRTYITTSEWQEFEIDKFNENLDGLIIAEKEFISKTAAENFIPSREIKSIIIKDVTDDLRYSNYNLARTQTIPTEI